MDLHWEPTESPAFSQLTMMDSRTKATVNVLK